MRVEVERTCYLPGSSKPRKYISDGAWVNKDEIILRPLDWVLTGEDGADSNNGPLDKA
jgi:hypothetical protein